MWETGGLRPSASWLSGGRFQRQIVLQAARSFGQPRQISRAALAGHTGLAVPLPQHLLLLHVGAVAAVEGLGARHDHVEVRLEGADAGDALRG